MIDHRPEVMEQNGNRAMLREITREVREHSTKHPGSVRRSDKNRARQTAKRSKASRRGNR